MFLSSNQRTSLALAIAASVVSIVALPRVACDTQSRGDPASSHSDWFAAHPETGRSVIVDDVTHEVLRVGGDGFEC